MSIDGESVSRVSCSRAQVEPVDVGVAALLQRQHHLLAVRREARAEGHVGKIADQLALAGLDVEEIDVPVAAGERGVGELLPRRREARRDDQVARRRSDSAHWRRPDP